MVETNTRFWHKYQCFAFSSFAIQDRLMSNQTNQTSPAADKNHVVSFGLPPAQTVAASHASVVKKGAQGTNGSSVRTQSALPSATFVAFSADRLHCHIRLLH